MSKSDYTVECQDCGTTFNIELNDGIDIGDNILEACRGCSGYTDHEVIARPESK